MRNVHYSDAELTDYSAEHLLYEFQLLLYTAKELSRQPGPSAMTSVLIESFGIHLRNLINFFFTASGKEKDDDVIAADFCPGWNENISDTLRNAKERANKELNHLTLARKSGKDPTKPWDVTSLFQEVSNVAKRFAAQASSNKLSSEIGKWLNAYHGNLAIAVVGAITTTNTTSTIVTSATVTKPSP